MKANSSPVPQPPKTSQLSASQAAVGAPIPPLRRLQIMEQDEWEIFILEWADSLRQNGAYKEVHQCGGKGDLGRDVIGYKGPVGPKTPWDNYQCKHYSKMLSVADVVRELGKLFFYASEGEFSLPDRYFFVAPKGPSTALLNTMQRGELKDQLITRWDTECRTKIAKNKVTPLTPQIRTLIDGYDFAKIEVLSPLKILEGHQKTTYYLTRFGGGLPGRTLPIPKPPAVFQPEETVYLKKLLDAYSDDKQATFASFEELEKSGTEFTPHLHNSREQFFSAESLRAFSRDNVPAETFEELQKEVFDGVQEVYLDSYSSGYRRVVETVKKSRDIQLTGNALVGVMHTNDRAGICHQLANDDKLTWVRDKKK